MGVKAIKRYFLSSSKNFKVEVCGIEKRSTDFFSHFLLTPGQDRIEVGDLYEYDEAVATRLTAIADCIAYFEQEREQLLWTCRPLTPARFTQLMHEDTHKFNKETS